MGVPQGGGARGCSHAPGSIWIVANTAGYEVGRDQATVHSVWVPSGGRGGQGGAPGTGHLKGGAVRAAGQAGEGPAGIQRER